jgi:hypothetical protein
MRAWIGRDVALVSALVGCAVVGACGGKGVFTYKEPTTTLITLGPATASGDSYRPSANTPANWTGYCPIPDQSAVLVSSGDPYSFVNKTDRTLMLTSPLAPGDTIAAGKQGLVFQSYGSTSQFSTVLEFRVVGCTDTLNGSPLFTVTVVRH